MLSMRQLPPFCIKFFPCCVKKPKRSYKSDIYIPSMARGIDHMRDPRMNKGLAFTIAERQMLGIHGMISGAVTTQKEQLKLCTYFIKRYKDPLDQYVYLVELQEYNERLFFSLLNSDIEMYMPLVYTPIVGLACQKFGLIYKRARGLFVSINDIGHVYDVLANWPERDIKAICFTDGERILGLGDLGAFGMGIPVGKLALYTVLAGVKPHQCLPVVLDVGTNNPILLEDPLYIGLRRKRATGKEYADLVEEFMEASTRLFGAQTLLQFEDFANPNAAPLLAKYRDRYTTFNDDIQGTAAVAVAGLYAATRITKKKMSENVYLFFGAGSAGTGIADLSVLAMVEEGLDEKKARGQIFMYDIDGVVTSKRSSGAPELCKHYSKDIEPITKLEQAVAAIKPTVLIGTSTVARAFTPAILQLMAKNAERPVIFALSNPTVKAECTAQDAYDHTEGRCVFASGSPFPPVQYNGKTYLTGQGNNAYIFPGLALGVICARSKIIPESMFLTSAKVVAEMVKEEDINMGRIYPPIKEILDISTKIAVAIMQQSYEKNLSSVAKPKNFEEYIKRHQYQLEYPDYRPIIYDYPAPEQHSLKTIEELYSPAAIPLPRRPI